LQTLHYDLNHTLADLSQIERILSTFKQLEDCDLSCDDHMNSLNIASCLSTHTMLRKLLIRFGDVSTMFLNKICKLKLTHLEVSFVNMIYNGPITKNYTIQELNIMGSSTEGVNIYELVKSCVFVDTLEICYCNIDVDTSLVILHELEFLRTLKIVDCTFSPICYPKITELCLFHQQSVEESVTFIRYNRQITKLTISEALATSPEFLSIRHELNAEISLY
jgi:hypothetical protein